MNGRERTLAVVLVALVVLGGIVAAVGPAGAQSDGTDHTYVVEQGDDCHSIEPLTTAETVASFYDYRNHETHPEGVDRMYSSYGTSHLQEDNASLLFLHEGTDGLSLVMVHDRVDGNTTGGVATFDVVGLPHAAEWEVRNDDYDSPSNMDEFDSGDGWADASWIWIEERTSGGAIQGGLDDPFAVTVHPAFNEDAEHYDNDDLYDPDWYDGGEIEEWHVLSGDADDPDRESLDSLEEPVTIRTGTCGDPSVTYDRTDDGIAATVADASPDDEIRLQPTTGTGDGVQFERVDVTDLEDTETFAFENRQPDDLPVSPADRESLGSLAGSDTQTVTANVTFTVETDVLQEHALEPERVALYESDAAGDGWIEANTTVTDETGAAVYFTAEATSLEALTVAESQEPEPTEDGFVSAIPGFGTSVAVGVILALAVAWAVRVGSRST